MLRLTADLPPFRYPVLYDKGTSAYARAISKRDEGVNVISLIENSDRYILLYLDNQRANALRWLGKWASNPQLSFTWYNAAVMSQKIRRDARAIDGQRGCDNSKGKE